MGLLERLVKFPLAWASQFISLSSVFSTCEAGMAACTSLGAAGRTGKGTLAKALGSELRVFWEPQPWGALGRAAL